MQTQAEITLIYLERVLDEVEELLGSEKYRRDIVHSMIHHVEKAMGYAELLVRREGR